MIGFCNSLANSLFLKNTLELIPVSLESELSASKAVFLSKNL